MEIETSEHNYLSAKQAKELANLAIKDIAANEYDTKQVLKQIEDAAHDGSFEIETYNDDKIRQTLVLLGYDCSEAYTTDFGNIYMKVSWS